MTSEQETDQTPRSVLKKGIILTLGGVGSLLVGGYFVFTAALGVVESRGEAWDILFLISLLVMVVYLYQAKIIVKEVFGNAG